MLGAPCDMNALCRLADEHNLLLLEDCAQSGGGTFKGRSLGTFGTFGAFSLNVFKTFTAGDGGVLLTNDTELYKRAFAIHDHGSFPNRIGVTDANSFLGLNLRMHELTGAVALPQLKKLNGILEKLRENKAKLLNAIGVHPSIRERKIHDVDGECATVLTYIFESQEAAHTVANNLGVKTLADSGKHNYLHMPQLRARSLPVHNPQFKNNSGNFSYEPKSLPQTDDLLSRSVSLSVGVVDSYLGTGFGINIHSDDADIERVAAAFSAQLR
jgi:dTDP-4-amino-4,6-dideoxygalactose transaminase